MTSEGIYSNVSESDYRSSPGISQSELKEFGASATPLHYKTRKPKEATADMQLGTLCHTAILQPELFDQSYHLRPDEYTHDVKGKTVMKPWHNGAEVCKAWMESHSDKIIATKDTIAKVNKIAARIRYIPEFKGALDVGQREVAFVKRDEETGLLLKCRCDLVATDASGITWIFDLKKVQRGGATHSEFSNSAANYGYFIQAAFYIYVTGATKFVFVPFDDDDPFDACLFEPDYDSIVMGRRQWRKLLDSYATCLKEDLWPGYPSFIQRLEAPKWMRAAT